MKRKCTSCKQEKQLTEYNFYKRLLSPGGYTSQCKECLIEKGRKSQQKVSEAGNWTKMFLGN